MATFVVSSKERRIIELIREKDYQTITIKVKDGKIVHVKREESIDLDLADRGNGKNPSL